MSSPFGANCWHEIKSRMIEGAGVRDGWLIVRFRNGACYRYDGAAPLLGAMVQAESAGKYFNSQIRPSYPFEKLEGEWPERLGATQLHSKKRRIRYMARVQVQIVAEKVCEVEAEDNPGEWRMAWSNTYEGRPVETRFETEPTDDPAIVPTDILEIVCEKLGSEEEETPRWVDELDAHLEELSELPTSED